MNGLFIRERIHTNYSRFFFEDDHINYLEESDIKILEGQLSFILKNNIKKRINTFIAVRPVSNRRV